jgi:hypothetical protein
MRPKMTPGSQRWLGVSACEYNLSRRPACLKANIIIGLEIRDDAGAKLQIVKSRVSEL